MSISREVIQELRFSWWPKSGRPSEGKGYKRTHALPECKDQVRAPIKHHSPVQKLASGWEKRPSLSKMCLRADTSLPTDSTYLCSNMSVEAWSIPVALQVNWLQWQIPSCISITRTAPGEQGLFAQTYQGVGALKLLYHTPQAFSTAVILKTNSRIHFSSPTNYLFTLAPFILEGRQGPLVFLFSRNLFSWQPRNTSDTLGIKNLK